MSKNPLDESFDVKSLRIADLRRILLEHNVNYPSSAKKQVLLDLFHEHVVNRQKNGIKGRRREKSDISGSVYDDLKTKQVKPKSTKKKSQEHSEDAIDVEKGNIRMSRRKSTHFDDLNYEEKEKLKEKPLLNEGFSNENFFQQQRLSSYKPHSSRTSLQHSMSELPCGLSPIFSETPQRSVMQMKSDVRLKNLVQPSVEIASIRPKPQKFMTNIENLRTSKQFHDMTIYTNSVHSPTIQTFENKESLSDDTILDKNEAEVEKEKIDIDKSTSHVLCNKSEIKYKRHKRVSLIKFFVIFVFGSFLIILLGIWREETIRLGYCDVEIQETPNIYSSIRKKIPKMLFDNLFIYCKPCPNHAICYPNYKLVCKKDYILAPNIFSLNGLIPITPSCIPDTEKLRKVHIIVNEAIEILRDKNAKLECGSLKLLKGEKEGVLEEDLEKYLWEMKSPNIDNHQFQELLSDALEDITTYDEISVENDGYVAFNFLFYNSKLWLT